MGMEKGGGYIVTGCAVRFSFFDIFLHKSLLYLKCTQMKKTTVSGPSLLALSSFLPFYPISLIHPSAWPKFPLFLAENGEFPPPRKGWRISICACLPACPSKNPSTQDFLDPSEFPPNARHVCAGFRAPL